MYRTPTVSISASSTSADRLDDTPADHRGGPGRCAGATEPRLPAPGSRGVAALRPRAVVEPVLAEVAEVLELLVELADLFVALGLRDPPGLQVGVEPCRGRLLHRRLDVGERLAVRLGDRREALAVAQLAEQRLLADADRLGRVVEHEATTWAAVTPAAALTGAMTAVPEAEHAAVGLPMLLDLVGLRLREPAGLQLRVDLRVLGLRERRAQVAGAPAGECGDRHGAGDQVVSLHSSSLVGAEEDRP